VCTAAVLELYGKEVNFARTFGEVEFGELFCYKNSNGLVEIASNTSSVADMISVAIGDVVMLR